MLMQNKPLWQSSLDNNCPKKKRDWLKDTGSFMQRLAQHGIQDAQIYVLSHRWIQPEPWESQCLGMGQGEVGLVREVEILSDSLRLCYARTVFTEGMVQHRNAFATLENQPLGNLLFTDPELTRGQFEFAYAEPKTLWAGFPPIKNEEAQWIRRSLFYLKNDALLLTEMIMPTMTCL